MRSYGITKSTFWNGETGRAIRAAGADAQLVALYLFTNPHANAIGIYYLPLVMMEREVALPMKRIRAAIAKLHDLTFAEYDDATEMFWVCEMLEHQIGPLKDTDGRVKAIEKLYAALPANPFLERFFDRYEQEFHLSTKRANSGALWGPQGEGKRGGSKGAYKGPQDLDPYPDPPPDPSQFGEGVETPLPAAPVARAAREQELPEAPYDQWIRTLVAAYPPQGVTSGHLTEHAFLEAMRRELPRPPGTVLREMRENLENHKRGYQWRVRRMIPKLERWLREGLWKQQHDEHPPAAAQDRTTVGAVAAQNAQVLENRRARR